MSKTSRHSISKLLLLAVIAALFSFVLLPVTAHAATKPSTPTMTSATVNGLTSVTVRWSRVSNANGYRLYRRTVDSGWKAIYTSSSNTSNVYTDSKVVPGTQYYYTVRAYKRTSSGNVLGNYNTTGISATLSLAAPTLVSATHTSQNTIKLQWKSPKGAQGFIVYRKQGGSWVKKADITSGSTTTWYDYNASSGSYQYTVKAYRKNGNKRVYGAYSKAGIYSNTYKVANYTSYVGLYGYNESYQSATYFNYNNWELRIHSASGNNISLQIAHNTRLWGYRTNIINVTLSGGNASFYYTMDSKSYRGEITLKNGKVTFQSSDTGLTGGKQVMEKINKGMML